MPFTRTEERGSAVHHDDTTQVFNTYKGDATIPLYSPKTFIVFFLSICWVLAVQQDPIPTESGDYQGVGNYFVQMVRSLLHSI